MTNCQASPKLSVPYVHDQVLAHYRDKEYKQVESYLDVKIVCNVRSNSAQAWKNFLFSFQEVAVEVDLSSIYAPLGHTWKIRTELRTL